MTATWSGNPITWVSGNLAASTMNTEIRDRMDWLKAADALHGITSASALGQLKSALYGALATRDGTVQAISNLTETAITLPTETVDSDAFHSTSSNTSRLTIPTGGGGVYIVGGAGDWVENATGARRLFLRKNGSNLSPDAEDARRAVSGWDTTQSIVTMEQVSAADYLEVWVWQDSGGSLNIRNVRLWALRVAA